MKIVIQTALIPFVAVLVMALIEALGREHPLWDRMSNVGWSLCVLGIGVTGGIFSNPTIQVKWGGEGAFIVGSLVILGNIGLGTLITLFRRYHNPAPKWVGNLCMAFGLFAFALPVGLTLWRG